MYGVFCKENFFCGLSCKMFFVFSWQIFNFSYFFGVIEQYFGNGMFGQDVVVWFWLDMCEMVQLSMVFSFCGFRGNGGDINYV